MAIEELQIQIDELKRRLDNIESPIGNRERQYEYGISVFIPQGVNYHVDRLKRGIFKRKAITADYTAELSDVIVAVTSISALLTVTLPSAVTVGEGKILIIKDETGTATTYNIDVTRSGTQTIDGATTKSITTNYSLLRLYSNGANWFTF